MLSSDLCLSVMYIVPKSRTERPRKTKIGTELDHVTRDSDTTLSRSKGQLVADVLRSQHAGTGATWRINTKILSTCKGGGLLWQSLAWSLLDLAKQCWAGQMLAILEFFFGKIG